MDQDTPANAQNPPETPEPPEPQSHRGPVLTPKQLKNRFNPHPPDQDTQYRHEVASQETLALAEQIRRSTSPSREQSLALTKLQEVRNWWNAAVSLDGAGLKANER